MKHLKHILYINEQAKDGDTHPDDLAETPIKIAISTENGRRCEELMADLINHFTPILFTPPATRIWIAPTFLQINGCRWSSSLHWRMMEFYKPLESLERIKLIDWGKEGLCASCVEDKKAEWTEEQETVWNLIDGWLGLDGKT